PAKTESSELQAASSPRPFSASPVLPILFWFATLAILFLIVAVIWDRGGFEMLWKSHTAVQPVPGLDLPEDHKFETKLLRIHIECVFAAGVCVAWAVGKKRVREV